MAITDKPFHQSSALHIAFGFLLMGGWTLFANRHHGLEASWLPALAQGVFSGLVTAVLKKGLEAGAGRLSGPLAYAVPPAISAATILTLLTVLHRTIGTPEVLATIAFPWTVSTLYAVVYNARLVRTA